MSDLRYFVSKYTTPIKLIRFDARKVAYGHGQYFDSWLEARTALMERLSKELSAARKEADRAERHYEKGSSLIDPAFRA